jgi:ADP-ribose pyrophosphatase YjhB (NUDIX family)
MNPKVRATAVLIEDDRILLVKQRVSDARSWSLPGGTLKMGENLEECVVREVKEETGLTVRVEELLYLGDRIEGDRHVVHITFAVNRVGGCLRVGAEPEPGANPIYGVEMVPIGSLAERGFDCRFGALAAAGFPGRGSYVGAVSHIGL